MPKTLLCIGECMIEMAPDGAGGFQMGFAGDTFNTAWYAQRIAGDTLTVGYLSAVGDDEPSGQMAAFMSQSGVTPHLAVRPGKTVGLYMISLKDGERSFSYWRDTSAARSLADMLDTLPEVQAGDIAYFSGITLAILTPTGRTRLLAALSEARGRGVIIAFDPNLRARLWPDTATMCATIMDGAAVSDIVLPSYEDEADFFGDADTAATAARYANAGASMVVVKDGADAVLIRSNDTTDTVTPAPVQTIVDTTAAGDSFNAAFLASYLSGDPAPKAAQAACALSARVISARGALVELSR